MSGGIGCTAMTYVVDATALPSSMTGGRAVRWRSWACLRCAGGGAIRWATEIDGDPTAEGPGGSLLLNRGERLYMTEKHVARQPSLAGALLLTKAHPPHRSSAVKTGRHGQEEEGDQEEAG